MKASNNYLTLSLIGAAVVALTACGGGGGSGPLGTTSISTTVMDGLIQNALVCIDATTGCVTPAKSRGAPMPMDR